MEDKCRDKEFDRPYQCLFNKAEKWSWNGNIIMVLDKHAKTLEPNYHPV